MKKRIVISGWLLLLGGAVAGCGNAATPSAESAPSSSTTATTAKKSTTASSSDTAGAKITVSLAEAIRLYQQQQPDATITTIELDTDFGVYYYKIEGLDDQYEHELKINAQTKEISDTKKEHSDSEDQAERKAAALDLDQLLTLGQISEIAEKAAGSGTAVEWDLDKENGITYWSVKVEAGSVDTEVKINAQTGAVLETEQDD